MAILDHVGDTRGRTPIILKDEKSSGLVTHDIDAANVDVGAVPWRHPHDLGAELLVAEDQIRGHHVILEDLLFVVDVVKKQVESGDTLPDARLDDRPILGQ